MNRFHVNSSLPRSGSELLQCLLAQHPQVYASPTSPLLEYVYGAQTNINTVESLSQPRDLMSKAFNDFCRAGAIGYYRAITDKNVVVDKSRGWIKYAEVLWTMFPKARIICMVRPIEEIIASLDRIYLANPGHPETRNIPIDYNKRVEMWLAPDSKPLGLMISRIQERQSKGLDNRIKYIPYGDLVDSTVEVMRVVFEHIELDAIDVDINNIRKKTIEDDRAYGIFGNHAVRSTISRV